MDATTSSSRPEKIISAENVWLKIGGKEVLQDVNLQVEQGELVALVGPSGCGKTSLLKILAGFIEPTAGKILLFDVSPQEAVKKGQLAFGFQQPTLLPWLDAKANASWLRTMRDGKCPDEIIDLFWEMLKLPEDIKNRKPDKISGGEKQRVSLVRTLALAKPQLFLLDEPLSGVDYLCRRQIVVSLRNAFKEKSVACIFVTHDLPDAIHFADRVVFSSSSEPNSFSSSLEVPQKCRKVGAREAEWFSKKLTELIKILENVG